ncbi:hypothetical protein BpHYR1_027371 [Brachionus plicatilis]|uniref:Uncharacterized protein n=1 Tax=Brachionus plicatilis TaxID=10195 RepID=A0A3M7PQA1_BRAPC|nr:hypothetical protein BpHYR1_027371 [Brachionus plicatilis]
MYFYLLSILSKKSFKFVVETGALKKNKNIKRKFSHRKKSNNYKSYFKTQKKIKKLKVQTITKYTVGVCNRKMRWRKNKYVLQNCLPSMKIDKAKICIINIKKLGITFFVKSLLSKTQQILLRTIFFKTKSHGIQLTFQLTRQNFLSLADVIVRFERLMLRTKNKRAHNQDVYLHS